tara:strand:+ start:1139 stop:1750 length:612 start_codon:yes stop_codon:yes gene_type:complete
VNGQEKKFERVNQKRRTRAELLRAARELTEKGLQPTVADVADHAGISRATAYRYFSKPEEMIREAALDAVAATIDAQMLEGGAVSGTAQQRVARVVTEVFAMVEANEPMFRALLASTVTGTNKSKRGGRRLGWLSEALEPLRPSLPAADFNRLVYGLSLLTGIETQIVFKDVCGLSAGEARDVSGWVAQTLLAGALAQNGKTN